MRLNFKWYMDVLGIFKSAGECKYNYGREETMKL